jgi:ABC-type transporter Mla maintaining outer membrane lipid asymmetry ATPase subunit MlaF
VTVRGPIRKYLEVDPILRRLLADACDGAPEANGASAPTPAGRTWDTKLDPDLLAIETRDLHKRFGAHRVLTGVDLRIPEGVVAVVLGPSGTGKSVLLQHIIGLMKPDGGEVLVRGRPLSRMSRSELLTLRAEMGVMFQDGALFSTMNVHDNVAFPLRQHTDLREPEIHEIVMEHLASVGLADAAKRMPNQLSGGMRKRAGLARALVLNPGIVLCDEPDSGLDPVRTALLADLLLEQHERLGGTMLVITHDVMLARRISDHISILWQGAVLESGTSDQIFASETDFVRQFLAGQSKGPLTMDA